MTADQLARIRHEAATDSGDPELAAIATMAQGPWGDEDHARALYGDHLVDLALRLTRTTTALGRVGAW